MAMLTFLVTITVLGVSSYAGYRLNMYLYARGALGGEARRVRSVGRELSSARRSRNGSLVQGQDYGLHYARTGVLIFAVLMSVIVISLIALISVAL